MSVKNWQPTPQVVKGFIGGFRTYNPPVQTHEAFKVTKPFGPVNVSKKKSIQQGVPNPSMAEGVQKWEKKIPERLHSSRQGEVFRMVQKFKAHGVDERVFKPPVLPVKKESKPTKIEAFHLTESHKKENVPPSHS